MRLSYIIVIDVTYFLVFLYNIAYNMLIRSCFFTSDKRRMFFRRKSDYENMLFVLIILIR